MLKTKAGDACCEPGWSAGGQRSARVQWVFGGSGGWRRRDGPRHLAYSPFKSFVSCDRVDIIQGTPTRGSRTAHDERTVRRSGAHFHLTLDENTLGYSGRLVAIPGGGALRTTHTRRRRSPSTETAESSRRSRHSHQQRIIMIITFLRMTEVTAVLAVLTAHGSKLNF